MKKTAICLAVGAALTATVAMADGPVPLTEKQLDSVTAAGIGFIQFDALVVYQKAVVIQIQELVDKATAVNVSISGYQAGANAGANCSALGCVAETLTLTDVNLQPIFDATGFPFVTAVSESFSAASPLVLNGTP